MNEITLPTFDELMNPLLQALRLLGGSGSVEEIYAKTVEIVGLSEEILAQNFTPQRKVAKPKLAIASRGRERIFANTVYWKTQVAGYGPLPKRQRALSPSILPKLSVSFETSTNRKRPKGDQRTKQHANSVKRNVGKIGSLQSSRKSLIRQVSSGWFSASCASLASFTLKSPAERVTAALMERELPAFTAS